LAQQECKTEIRHRILFEKPALSAGHFCAQAPWRALFFFVSCSQCFFIFFFDVVGIILFIIFIHKFIYLNMKKQLIKEAKRLQELAGIRPLNENERFVGSNDPMFLWFYPTVDNPDEMVSELDYDHDTKKITVIDTFSKGEVIENNELRGNIGEMYGKKDKDGTWRFSSHGGDFHFGGFKEGEDFALIPKDKMQPLYDAYESYRGETGTGFDAYLLDNDFELETGTEEWMDLVEIVGEENMPEYINFLENTLKLNIF